MGTIITPGEKVKTYMELQTPTTPVSGFKHGIIF